ncbi:DUF4386 domain-containing protein [Nonomuraea turkmeniaca]|uniref:DUF4386 domain-containing protein n=1 Tax=Nonomuraea turkmeniaca TaxID=103838 RepID=A0A5S4FP52_9ACTN|nr:DUF4386 domain-containing protein [Nonomuraea turkmeniaca]TMR22527.1 DUF4386 domain-containing protein [Nonomuraea turkmeniaca]
MTTTETTHQPIRRAALIAGAALLALAVLSGLANFGVMENLVTEGDAEKTAHDIREAGALFRYGVAGFFLTAILDVVAAWALLVFFAPVHEGLATLAAWLRAVHAGVFTVAIAQLAAVPRLLAAGTTDQLHAEALSKINTFHEIWDGALGLFGVHLALLGYLAYKSRYVPTWVGVLLVIAGLGYLVDTLGALLVPGYTFEVSVFTFVGEAVLMIWLVVKGRSVTVNGRTPASSIR